MIPVIPASPLLVIPAVTKREPLSAFTDPGLNTAGMTIISVHCRDDDYFGAHLDDIYLEAHWHDDGIKFD